MDGRRFRRWALCGGLVLGGVGCKTDQPTLPDGTTLPMPTQKRSMWSSNPTLPSAAAEASMPPRKPGEPFKPNTLAALADAQVAAATDDKNPSPNRDVLLDGARAKYQQALKADPKNKASLLGLARLYARIGDQERADEVFRQYLTHYPKDHAVVHEVAVTHARSKDWAGAVAWCEAALKIDPENREYRKFMGFCQAHGGNWDGAFTTLKQMMPEATARYHLARALDQAGQPEVSKQQLQYALQADPSFEAARDMLAELNGGGANTPPTTAEEANPIRQTGYQPR
jgi:thioredoxin-like negative regulator of GroEL